MSFCETTSQDKAHILNNLESSHILFVVLCRIMSDVSSDRNYTDPANSGVDSIDRVGTMTGDPADNQAIDREKAAKLANLLEGLDFPASKEDVKNHLNRKSPAMGNRINDVIEAVWNNLEDNRQYGSAYEVEQAAGLVKETK